MSGQLGFSFLDTVETLAAQEAQPPKKRRQFEKTCLVCDAVFMAGSPVAKYCSRDCRQTAAKIRRDVKDSLPDTQEPEQPPTSNVIEFPRSAATRDVNVGSEVLEQLVENQQAQIERLERMIALQQDMLDALLVHQRNQQHQSLNGPRALQTMPKMKAVSTPLTFNGPPSDDDPQVTVRKATTDSNSSQNFLNSLMALNG